jgi:hypothetical protein
VLLDEDRNQQRRRVLASLAVLNPMTEAPHLLPAGRAETEEVLESDPGHDIGRNLAPMSGNQQLQ